MGNTFFVRQAGHPPAVHPHVCGEYFFKSSKFTLPFGSSPRVWGIPLIEQIFRACHRFIPTCVGNTWTNWTFWQFTAVHPHVCGEYVSAGILKARAIFGSSPRVWGIPWASYPCVWAVPVHPHVCGEYYCFVALDSPFVRFIPTCVGNTSITTIIQAPVDGSSPRVWGIHRQCQPQCARRRFIPTCVGNTFTSLCVFGKNSGSSPRVWGILLNGHMNSLRARFIPTCVGNTYTTNCPLR